MILVAKENFFLDIFIGWGGMIMFSTLCVAKENTYPTKNWII